MSDMKSLTLEQVKQAGRAAYHCASYPRPIEKIWPNSGQRKLELWYHGNPMAPPEDGWYHRSICDCQFCAEAGDE